VDDDRNVRLRALGLRGGFLRAACGVALPALQVQEPGSLNDVGRDVPGAVVGGLGRCPPIMALGSPCFTLH